MIKMIAKILIVLLSFNFYPSLTYAQLPIGSHCSNLEGDPSGIIPDSQSSAFQTPENFAALINLAQNSNTTPPLSIGAGKAPKNSTIYYISPKGRRGAGTKNDPWNLKWANQSLKAGETGLLLGGTYESILDPNHSGTINNPITIKAAPGAKVHLKALGTKPAVRILHNYIHIEGFTISRKDYLESPNSHTRANNVIVRGDHITIRNMRIVNNGDYICQNRQANEKGISIGGSYGLYENNYINHMSHGLVLNTNKNSAKSIVIRGNTIANSFYDGIRIGNSNGDHLGYLIEKNVIFGGLVNTGISFDSGAKKNGIKNHKGINGVIIRNNAIFYNAENSINLKGAENIVIEGNYLWKALGDKHGSNVVKRDNILQTSLTNKDNGGGSSIWNEGITNTRHIIIRRNVMIDSNQGTVALNDFKIYNNTILNNRRNASQNSNVPTFNLSSPKPGLSGIVGNTTGPNATILNNIIGDHGYEVVISKTGSAQIDGNAYYNSFQFPLFSVFTKNGNWTSLNFNQWQTWLRSEANYSGNEIHSQLICNGTENLFVHVLNQPVSDPALMDFSLASHSKAIDGGVFLTKTIGNGNSTIMTVEDAGVFIDGFEITDGDKIQLEGQKRTATIINIEGNQLTLDKKLSWTSGLGVSLTYQGKAPDIGAIESNSAASNSSFSSLNDIDQDGTSNFEDNFPTNPNESIDTDMDCIGNNADTDDDNDGFADLVEISAKTDPLNPVSLPTSSASLIAHYTFDQLSENRVLDISGNNHHAKKFGTYVIPGKIGSALQFNQSKDKIVSNGFDIYGNNITLSAWIKVTNFGEQETKIISKSKGHSNQDHYWVLSSTQDNNGKKLHFHLKTNGQTTLLMGNLNIPTKRWVHVAATYDGQTMRLYLDGKEDSSLKKSGVISTNASVKIQVGNQSFNDEKTFSGAIDDVRIYDIAFSKSEIHQIANGIIPSPKAKSNKLIFENGFEKGNAEWNGEDAPWRKVPANAAISNNAREGNKSVKFLPLADNIRSEMVIKGKPGTFKWGEEYWVGFSINVQKHMIDNGSGIKRNFKIISQHHSVPRENEKGKPDWNLNAGPNGFTIRAEEGAFRIFTSTNPENVDKAIQKTGGALSGTEMRYVHPYKLNTWYDFVLHFRYAPDNSGFMEVFIDGEKKIDVQGPTVYKYALTKKGDPLIQHPVSPIQYQKIGIYYGYGAKNGEILYDAFRIGNKNARYEDVAPRGKLPR